MKRYMALAAVFSVFSLAATPSEAGGVQFYLGSGYGGFGYRSPSHNYYHGSHGCGYGRGGRVWHDTSHYDYHPGGYVRHRNHYDYVPGHYDFHRTGHWDRIGRGYPGHRH